MPSKKRQTPAKASASTGPGASVQKKVSIKFASLDPKAIRAATSEVSKAQPSVQVQDLHVAAFGKYLVVVRLNKDADGWVKDQQKVIALLKSLGLTGFKFADDMGTGQKKEL